MSITHLFNQNYISKAITVSAICLLGVCNSDTNIQQDSDDPVKPDNFGFYHEVEYKDLNGINHDLYYEQYEKGNVFETFIYLDQTYTTATKEQKYLNELTDIARKSEKAACIIETASKENLRLFINHRQKNHGIFWFNPHEDVKYSISLKGDYLYNTELNEEERKKKKAHDVMTLLEELSHFHQWHRFSTVINKRNKHRNFKKLTREAGAKTNKIILMQQIKENGGEETWEYAQRDHIGSPIDGMMDYYNENYCDTMSDNDLLKISTHIYQIIYSSDALRKRYPFNKKEQKLHDAVLNNSDIEFEFIHLPTEELDAAGHIPGTDLNFILPLKDKSNKKNKIRSLRLNK